MSMIPKLLQSIPGLAKWKGPISQAWELSRDYKNSRQDLMRAIADRNLNLQDLQKGLGYLQNGPVHNILNMIAPGSAEKLHQLGNEIIGSGQVPSAQQGQSGPENNTNNANLRRENPFPPLKQ